METPPSQRAKRKDEHLEAVLGDPLSASAETRGTHFDDIYLIPNCLPELALRDIDLSTTVAGLALAKPVVINAMTGGTPKGLETNRALARAAASLGLAMAVGSQTIALEAPETSPTFTVVREENPSGIVFANLPAGATPGAARRAVDALQADALQLHLNAAQELAMPEGDRDFRGRLAAIQQVCRSLDRPVIVKEVGSGIAREQARMLREAGVAAIDVGGAGGTDFRDVEQRRAGTIPGRHRWGLPTAITLIEVSGSGLGVVAGGGIRTGLDAVKAFALGASAVSIAAPLVRSFRSGGQQALEDYLERLLADIRETLLLSGAGCVGQAASVPLVFSGLVRDWVTARQLNR